jgi:putative ABC transport system substrate-binding protein
VKRREFITLIGGAVAGWPLATHAQQPAMAVVGFVSLGSAAASAPRVSAFRKGLSETGHMEGQNVTVEYHWLDGRFDRLPSLMADLVRRRVAVIATPGQTAAAQAAKAATTTIPIVFGVGEDPVKLDLVSSLARPGGNATGINYFVQEVLGKRLGLLHELLPKAVRIAVLVNPANAPVAEVMLRDMREAARALGLQTRVLNASTSREIEAAFATFERERADALFIAPDGFFTGRSSQFVTLASRDRIPTSCGNREMVEAGLLMSYGTDNWDMFHRVGVYTGQILKGANPADLPVLQSTKFQLVINMKTAKALGIEVPNSMQLLADEVIE